jgi:microcin C transport system substrate-binding protein
MHSIECFYGGYYVVPQYHKPEIWLAWWNKFGIPDKQPKLIGVDIDSFWIDPEKEKVLAAKYKGVN